MNRQDEYLKQQLRGQYKDYRERFHAAREAVEEIDTLDIPGEAAMANYHSVIWHWGSRLLPRDVDKLPDYAREDHGEYSNVREAWEAELFDRSHEDPADPGILEEIGETLEELTVRSLDLPRDPPVVDPWEPASAEETRERIEELREQAPDLDVDGLGGER